MIVVLRNAWRHLFLFTLWLLLFLLGYHCDSMQFRGILQKSFYEASFSPWTLTGALFGALLTWTWTNCLLLCCLASIIGEIGRVSAQDDLQYPIKDYRPPLARAFFIFMLMLSGQWIMAGGIPELNSETGPDNYFRLAVFVSLLGFVVGYDPRLFGGLLEKIGQRLHETGQPLEQEEEARQGQNSEQKQKSDEVAGEDQEEDQERGEVSARPDQGTLP